jgi:hypothetical protein
MPVRGLQVPPFKQGLPVEQGLTSFSQFFPVKPGLHWHLYSMPVRGLQVPPFKQGLPVEQGLTSFSQFFPTKPGLQ